MTGIAGYVETDTVTASGIDDDSSAVTGSDTSTVTLLAATGQIAPTATTCQQFRDGTAGNLTDLFYGIKANKVNNVAPGVMFYYSKLTAPATSPFTITVDQTITNNPTNWKKMAIQDLGQVILWNSNCTKTVPINVQFNATTGRVTITVASPPATPGATYYLSIKYDPGSLVGENATGKPSPTYTFTTSLNGTLIFTSGDSILVNPK